MESPRGVRLACVRGGSGGGGRLLRRHSLRTKMSILGLRLGREPRPTPRPKWSQSERAGGALAAFMNRNGWLSVKAVQLCHDKQSSHQPSPLPPGSLFLPLRSSLSSSLHCSARPAKLVHSLAAVAACRTVPCVLHVADRRRCWLHTRGADMLRGVRG